MHQLSPSGVESVPAVESSLKVGVGLSASGTGVVYSPEVGDKSGGGLVLGGA